MIHFLNSVLKLSYGNVCPLGGAHEGLQHLGPYGNIPNIVAELTGDNVPKDFSQDHGYPDPPNPCPLGKTGTDMSSTTCQITLNLCLNIEFIACNI